jgi:hypothetical protein
MVSSDVLVFNIDSYPLGMKYDQWCIKWWIWLLSIPKSTNPVMDLMGNFAHTNQENKDVFFLCQTIESRKPLPTREIRIPFGGKIFLPIINWICFKDNEEHTHGYLKKLAKEKIDSVGNLELYINDKILDEDLSKYRVQPPIFEMKLPEDNILGIKPGLTSLVTDGYWIFFEPLIHDIKLSSFGSCSLGITEIGVNYQIKLV